METTVRRAGLRLDAPMAERSGVAVFSNMERENEQDAGSPIEALHLRRKDLTENEIKLLRIIQAAGEPLSTVQLHSLAGLYKPDLQVACRGLKRFGYVTAQLRRVKRTVGNPGNKTKRSKTATSGVSYWALTSSGIDWLGRHRPSPTTKP